MPANSSNRGLTLRKKTSFKKRLYKKVPRPVPNIHSVVPQRLGGIYNIALNTSTGWNGVDNSIQFTFTLDGVYAKIGTGSNNLVLAWVNTTYLCALYSLYRLKSLKCTVMCGSNTSQINVSNSWSIIYGVVDDNDNIKLASAQDALAYDNRKVMQLGANGFDYGKQVITCKGLSSLGYVENDTGATGQVAAQKQKSPWINCLYPDVPHYGLKFYNNLPGGTASTNYVDCFFGHCSFIGTVT